MLGVSKSGYYNWLNTTKNNKNMLFSTFIDQQGDYFDVVHFTKVVDKYPIYGIGVYACYGKVTQEFGHFSIDAIWTKKIALKTDPRASDDIPS
jgi:DNA polymerase-3 subunit alpha